MINGDILPSISYFLLFVIAISVVSYSVPCGCSLKSYECFLIFSMSQCYSNFNYDIEVHLKPHSSAYTNTGRNQVRYFKANIGITPNKPSSLYWPHNQQKRWKVPSNIYINSRYLEIESSRAYWTTLAALMVLKLKRESAVKNNLNKPRKICKSSRWIYHPYNTVQEILIKKNISKLPRKTSQG